MYSKSTIMNNCQLMQLKNISDPLQYSNIIFQKKNRVKRIFKRRLNYIKNLLEELKHSNSNVNIPRQKQSFKKGDFVKVRSREDIKLTLNRWNQLKGCAFMPEMTRFCKTHQRIFKKVGQFLDERDYLIKKCNGIYILENVFCEGTDDFGHCDRSCFFFWREEWLEKAET